MRQAIIRTGYVLSVLALGLMGLVQAQPAMAGSLTVLPVRVEVAAGQQFCSINIGNDGTTDVTVQVRGYPWQQRDGSDVLDETQRIAINPSIVTIPPQTKKLVRCGLPEQSGPLEGTYRLIVSELPRANVEPGTLQTLLQLSIPVFRAQPDSKPVLYWKFNEDGQMVITNAGTRHVRIADIIVQSAAAAPSRTKAGFYLLAGASRTISSTTGEAAIEQVEAMAEDGSFLAVLPDHMRKP